MRAAARNRFTIVVLDRRTHFWPWREVPHDMVVRDADAIAE